MKETKISELRPSQLSELSIDLFEIIEMTYGISPADDRFTEYFTKTLQQNYSHLTFEDLESAFERNASGLLDIYLPKVGQRADNKVLKFNIPDLTKIINAYCKYKGIEKSENQQQKKVFTLEEKKEIRRQWCDQLIENFEKYKNYNERPQIRIPLYTCKVLVKFGIIEDDEIDYSESKTNILSSSTRTNNENLIFNAFDRIISQGMHIKEFIGSFYEYEENEILY